MKTSAESPIRIDWIPIPGLDSRLGVTLCPGKKDEKWDRDLDKDLQDLSAQGMDMLVSLMPESEYPEVGLDCNTVFLKVKELGKEFSHFVTWPDREIPSSRNFGLLSFHVKQSLECGKNVVIHCRGGIERSGTLVAGVLNHFGYPMWKAILRTKQYRVDPRTISPLQEDFLMALERKMDPLQVWIADTLTQEIHTGDSISYFNFLNRLWKKYSDTFKDPLVSYPRLVTEASIVLRKWEKLGLVSVMDSEMIVPADNFMEA